MKMTITIILLGLIILIIGMVSGLKTLKPISYNFVAGTVVVIVTLFGLCGKQLYETRSSEKTDSIKKTGEETSIRVQELTLQNMELTSQNEDLKSKSETTINKLTTQEITIDKLRQENMELYTRLANASLKIYENLTGGENYCHIEFDDGMDLSESSTILLHVINESEYPISDVHIQIVDVLDADNIKATVHPDKAPYAVMGKMFQKKLGTIGPKTSVAMTKDLLHLPEGNVGVYEIHILQRNGTVSQVVRFEKINNSWTFATKATLLDDTKVIWQQIHKDYPRQEIDNTEWWKGN